VGFLSGTWTEQRGHTEGLRRMKAGTDRREFRKVRPSKSRKGRCGRPWSEGSPDALSEGRSMSVEQFPRMGQGSM